MATRGGKFINSILLVDDDEDSLELYAHLLKERLDAEVHTTRYPSKALKLSQKHFFDIVLLDVTIDYNGTPFGGLELHKSLMGRYGDSSLIVYSQYITDDLLKQYDYDFNFVERGSNPIRFIDRLVGAMDSLRKKQTCFVAMPFHKSYVPLYRAVETCVKRASYRCVRIDRQHFTKSIIEKIFTEINNAKLIIFLATDQNPNAFYECGYAVALDKEVITLTDVHKNLPFDIRDRSAIAYGADLKSLKSALSDRLSNLTR